MATQMIFKPKLKLLEDFQFIYRGRRTNYSVKPVYVRGKKFAVNFDTVPTKLKKLFAEAILSKNTVFMSIEGPHWRDRRQGFFTIRSKKGLLTLSSVLIKPKDLHISRFDELEREL